jgi:polyhydroxyalkanoate synthesis repressor PhaR
MPTEPRIIKRYANRKLYDTSRSCYITLEEIAAFVRAGEEIRIIDNKTKEDLTSVTMAQILVEEEKRQPRGTRSLRGLIEQSGELLQKKLGEPVHTLRANVEDSVNRFLRQGEERAAETRHQIQTWVDQKTLAVEEAQARLDERIKSFVPGHGQHQLQRELQRLSERLDRIEAHLGLGRLDPPDEPGRP